MVTEYAKDLTWEERHNILIYDQLYVTAKQNRRLVRLKNKVDIAITDSPIILGMMYRDPNYLPKTFDSMLFELFNQYKNVNYLLQRKKPYSSIGRNQTEEEAIVLDLQINEVLDSNSIDYKNVPGDESAMDVILEDLRILLR